MPAWCAYSSTGLTDVQSLHMDICLLSWPTCMRGRARLTTCCYSCFRQSHGLHNCLNHPCRSSVLGVSLVISPALVAHREHATWAWLTIQGSQRLHPWTTAFETLSAASHGLLRLNISFFSSPFHPPITSASCFYPSRCTKTLKRPSHSWALEKEIFSSPDSRRLFKPSFHTHRLLLLYFLLPSRIIIVSSLSPKTIAIDSTHVPGVRREGLPVRRSLRRHYVSRPSCSCPTAPASLLCQVTQT